MLKKKLNFHIKTPQEEFEERKAKWQASNTLQDTFKRPQNKNNG